MKSIHDNLYVTVSENETSHLLVKSKTIEEFETFESVDVPKLDVYDEYYTVIAIRSALNGKYVYVDENDYLKVDKENLTEAEKFTIFYGSNGTVAIKSKQNNRFVNAVNDMGEIKLGCKKDFISNFLTFELVPIDFTAEALKVEEDVNNKEEISTDVQEHRYVQFIISNLRLDKNSNFYFFQGQDFQRLVKLNCGSHKLVNFYKIGKRLVIGLQSLLQACESLHAYTNRGDINFFCLNFSCICMCMQRLTSL